jgi:hypothetical protein
MNELPRTAKLHQNDEVMPANIGKAVNFYQINGRLHGRSAIRAPDPARTQILGNFRFDYKGSAYNCRAYPWYDRIFSKAHPQIECDPIVWKQAESLIRQELDSTGSNAAAL